MEFATKHLGDALLHELKTAKKATAAVAFFNPDETVLSAIKKVPKLKLLVAEDFQINNPYKLESLCRPGTWVRAVRADANAGKLHSKVFLIKRRNGSSWAMVGSANLTRPGLYSNQEACVVFDSRRNGDAFQISQIETWLDEICSEDRPEIDFDVAKAVYDTRSKFKSSSSSNGNRSSDSQPNAEGYWALKPGKTGECWQEFLAENVIAIGWNKLKGNPSVMSPEQIDKAYRATWPEVSDGHVNVNVPQITKFSQSMGGGDLVLICGRYDSVNENKDVYIYGVARTESKNGKCFFDDKRSGWFRFKRHAAIQRIEEFIPQNMIAIALGKGSLAQTIHALDKDAFDRLADVLSAELGIAINV